MGTQFALIYDIIVLAVIGGMIFAGVRKGFASVIVGIAAVFVAFVCAMIFSAPVSEALYDRFIEKPVSEAVDSALDDSMSAITLSGMDKVDFDNIRISGVAAADYSPKYDGTSKAVVDLSDLDLSGSGIENADLSAFGIDSGMDLSCVNAKTAEFTMSEIETYGIGKLAAAQFIAVSAADSDFLSSFAEYTDSVAKALPSYFSDMAQDIKNGGTSAIRTVVLNMMDATSSVREALIEKIVRPVFIMAVQTVLFIVIFIVVQIVLGLAARGLKIVNKIPVIGSVNSAFGGVAGFLQGLITVCVICIVFRFGIALSGGNVVFFNETAINSTYLFKWFYNFEFLNFLT